MAKQRNGLTSRTLAARLSLARASWAVFLLGLAACGANHDIPSIETVCGTVVPADSVGGPACGAGDLNLPAEPQLPTDACQTLTAVKSAPTERDDATDLDTARVQTALLACKGKAVKLVSDGDNNAFVTGHLQIDSVTLWIDKGTTLYASRNPALYQKTGNCGSIGINDSGACTDFITLAGQSPAIVGDGHVGGAQGCNRIPALVAAYSMCGSRSGTSPQKLSPVVSAEWPSFTPA